MKLILLRARSGPRWGMGHVMRSRSIAQCILERGDTPILVVDDEHTRAALARESFSVVTAEEHAAWTEESAAGVWLDGYGDWEEELPRLAARGTPVYLVENRTAAREACERLVYPALHWTPDDWDREHPERVLAGADWIPLADDIRAARERLSSPRATGPHDAGAARDIDLLITLGGSDPARLTELVLSALDLGGLRVVIAVGPHMADRRSDLAEAVGALPDAVVLPPGTRLAPWMARSRAAITALGTTLYELAYLGVPALVLANHDSDREALTWYGEHGPHRPVGIAHELSSEGLRAALRSGFCELRDATMPEVPGLGTGASRLAALLAGEAA